MNSGLTNKSPLISFIIPCFNSENNIGNCLKSLTDQRFKDFEIIIIDSLSEDRTIEIVEQFQFEFPNITVVSEKDKGIYDAMNKGINYTKGQWINFMGSDDFLYNSEVLNEISKENLNYYDFIYGKAKFLYSGEVYGQKKNLYSIIYEGNICHQAIFYRKSIFDKIGFYDISCKIYADHDFNIRIFQNKNIKKYFSNRIVCVYNESDGFSAKSKDDSVFRFKQEKYIEMFNSILWNKVNISLIKPALYLLKSLLKKCFQ